MAALIQPSFSSGEISPKLHARVDLARYQTALAFLRNCMVLSEGGATNRAGTRFVDALTGFSILMPFIYSTEQAYLLVISEGEVLLFANGGFVQNTASVNISNIAILPIPPYTMQVTTSSPHGLVEDQQFSVSGLVASGDYDITGTNYVGTVVSPTIFDIPRLAFPPSGFYGSGGVITTSIALSNTYDEDELEQLRFTQSNDVLTVFHKDHPPHELRRITASQFSFEPGTYENGPFIPLNTVDSVLVHATNRVGTVVLNATGDIFTPEHVGGLFFIEPRNLSENPPWESNKKLVGAAGNPLGLKRRSDGKTYRCVTSQVATASHEIWTGTVRPIHDSGTVADGDGNALQGGSLVERAGVAWEFRDSGFGILRITEYTSGSQVTAVVVKPLPDEVVGGEAVAASYPAAGDGVTVDFSIAGATQTDKSLWQVKIDNVEQSPDTFEIDIPGAQITFYTAPANGTSLDINELSQNNRSEFWAFGAWSEAYGYPSVGTYWQDRLVTAASRSQSNTVWGSKSGEYPDFGVSSPIVDSDAVDFTMNARQQNAIVDLLPLDNLIAVTAVGAWKVTDGQNQVLTPSTVGFKPQSYKGAANKRGIIIGDEAVYPQAGLRKLRTLGYTITNDKFSGINLTALAGHLFTRTKTIRDMDYAEEPHAQLWVTRSDGRLISVTYEREQDTKGFGRHDTRGGSFIRVCSIPENNENAVYFYVQRTVNGQLVHYLERLAEREFQEIEDAMFLDCAISYDGRNETATTMTLSGSGWTVTDTLTLTASASTFTADHVGDEIWLHVETQDQDERGEPVTVRVTARVTIESYTSPTVVTVVPLADIPATHQAVAFTTWTFAHDTFTGADHLEGLECGVMADGEYRGLVTVENAGFTISPPGGVVHLGRLMISEGETLDVNFVGEPTVRHHAKSIPTVRIDVLETRGVTAGPDRDHLEDVAERSQLDYDAQDLLTDVLSYRIPAKNNTNGSIVFRQAYPLPMTIRAVIPEVEIGEPG